jgi:hypothetical protein
MKRALFFLFALVSVSSCSNSNDVAAEKKAVNTGQCVPSEENPTLGLAAITDKYRVRVWDDALATEARELEQIADDPYSNNTGYDLTVVESAALSTRDCKIFVGACCEPVSGITFYEGKNKGEWLQLTGHLPAISPDGERLALVGYEELTVSSVDAPDKILTTIGLPKSDVATMYQTAWLNDDQVAVSGFTSQGALLWIATISKGTLRPAQLITDEMNWGHENLWRVGLVGVDENKNIVTRVIGTDGNDILQFRDAESFETRSTSNISDTLSTYTINGARRVTVDQEGVLSVWWGTRSPLPIGDDYSWAG